MQVKKTLVKFGAGLVTAVGAVAANAAATPVDTSGISDQAANVNLVGVAVFGILVAIAGWKFMRRAL
ncbi:MAG TPA: major capsid protein [Burkholderiaceae bacterium]